MAEESNFLKPELALLKLGIQLILPQHHLVNV
jgi:hypothetical protein